MAQIDKINTSPEFFEVVEALLNLCLQKETQIGELMTELENLRSSKSTGKPPEIKSAAETGKSLKDRKFGILIADDSDIMRHNLAQIFRSAGCEIQWEAHNGSEAVEIYRIHRPALVTMDTDMPIMDGYEATRRIVEIDPQARVIIVSHVLNKGSILEAVKVGASDYIAKPVQSSRFLNVIHRFIAD